MLNTRLLDEVLDAGSGKGRNRIEAAVKTEGHWRTTARSKGLPFAFTWHPMLAPASPAKTHFGGLGSLGDVGPTARGHPNSRSQPSADYATGKAWGSDIARNVLPSRIQRSIHDEAEYRPPFACFILCSRSASTARAEDEQSEGRPILASSWILRCIREGRRSSRCHFPQALPRSAGVIRRRV